MATVLLGRICRTCLKNSDDMHKLHEFIVDDLQIELMLNQTIPNFDLEMDDIPLPVEICKECLNKLQTCYDFVQMCFKSKNELKNMFNLQEQEIESSLDEAKLEFFEETDIVMERLKKEPHDDDSNFGRGEVNDAEDHSSEALQLEVDTQSQCEKNSSDEYLPNDDELSNMSSPVESRLNNNSNKNASYKKHKCIFCDKNFPNSSTLKYHVRVHTREAPFLCPKCGKSFKSGHVLRQHALRHGEKKFHCLECPMKFYNKVNLNKHMISHTKLKSHVCDICGLAYTRQDSLKAHKFKHSGERPYKCEDCKKSFVFKCHLKRHKMIHSGEKPHTCEFCKRQFAASGDLVKHLRTHIGENTYFCDECPESFKYSHDLRDHKNQHYKEKLNLEQKTVTTEKQNEAIQINTGFSVVTLYKLEKNVNKRKDGKSK